MAAPHASARAPSRARGDRAVRWSDRPLVLVLALALLAGLLVNSLLSTRAWITPPVSLSPSPSSWADPITTDTRIVDSLSNTGFAVDPSIVPASSRAPTTAPPEEAEDHEHDHRANLKEQFLDTDTSTSISTSTSTTTTKTMSMPAQTLRKTRAVNAVLGGFIADAATMGLHWIYDSDALAQLVAATPGQHPEFHTPPSCPFYQYESGALSPYGDEILPLLEDVATRGAFQADAFAMASYHAAKVYPGRLNHAMKELVVKGDAGHKYPDLASESKDLHGAIKVPVLIANAVATGADLASLVQLTRDATRVHQIGQLAEDAAVTTAVLLHSLVVDGDALSDAIKALPDSEYVSSELQDIVKTVVEAVKSEQFPDAVTAIAHFGKACGLPGSLQGALYVLLTTDGYVDAVRTNMVAGGDNCSRSILVGACAAAAAEGEVIPTEWTQKTKRYNELKTFAETLVL